MDIELKIEEVLDEITELDCLLASNPLNATANARRTYLARILAELLK